MTALDRQLIGEIVAEELAKHLPPVGRTHYRVSEVAAMQGVSCTKIRQDIAAGRLKATKRGGTALIPRSEVA